jgi:hypothetical protein
MVVVIMTNTIDSFVNIDEKNGIDDYHTTHGGRTI